MPKTSHTPFTNVIPQTLAISKVSLSNTPTGTATDTNYFYSNTTFSASYDILDKNFVAFKSRFISGGIASTGAGNAMGMQTVFRPHASDTADPAYIGAIFDLVDSNDNPTTTNVGSASKIGIIFRGVGWSSNLMSLDSDVAFAAGQQITNDNGKSFSIVAGDGNGTDKNGGGINLTGGAATGTGTHGGITLSVQGSNTNIAFRSVTTQKIGFNTINGMQALADGMQIGMGRVTAPAQVSAAATTTLTVGTNDSQQRFDFAAGGGAYTYNIDLIKSAGEVEGCQFELYISKAASTNPTIVVRNGSGGATLVSLNNGTAQNWYMKFVFDGTNWVKQAAIINDL